MKQAQSGEAQRVVSEIERVASGLVGRIGVAARAIDGKEVLTINVMKAVVG